MSDYDGENNSTLPAAHPLNTTRTSSPTRREFVGVMVPITLAYLSTPLLGLVDTAVIGQLDDAAMLGGLAVGALIFDFIGALFYFMRAGTTALTAQAVGAGNGIEVRYVLVRALLIAGAAGIICLLVQWPVLSAGLWLLGGSDSVQEAARSYFSLRLLSAPFFLANYAILGWLLGQGRAKSALLLQTLLNGLNTVLSIAFVLVFDWEITGVALATVLSEVVTLLFGLMLVRVIQPHRIPLKWPQVLERKKVAALFSLNRDIMLRSLSMLVAFGFFTNRSAVQGEVILAANAVLDRFFLIGGYFLDGAASATEQFVGRAIGAKNKGMFKRSVHLSLEWGFILSGILTGVFIVFGVPIIHLMSVNSEVRLAGETYLLWAALTPLVGNLAFQMDGVFIGAAWSREMRNMMLISTTLFIAAALVLQPLFGNHGLWAAMLLFLAMRGGTLSWRCWHRTRSLFT
ncbi:MATE family efflux transporter [Polycladidibacter stylochi]|uniref:MATE family efflux transporter n=1 Tax=Polycladidibacter stylochi TaxID=1807766 RepID=UPI0009E9A839|nr:MATE family efflux transporter [Pseudovibrio stylochi]